MTLAARAAVSLLAAVVFSSGVSGPSALAQQSGVARTLLAQVDDLRKEKKEAEALETADRAADVAHETGDREAEADGALMAGRILYSMGRFAESQARYERARPIAAALADRTRQARVQHGLGNAAWGVGRFGDARVAYQQAIVLYRELHMRSEALTATHGLLLSAGGADERQRVLDEAIAEAVAVKDGAAEGTLRQDAGDAAFNRGHYAEAFEQLQKARQLAEASGDQRQVASVLTSIGRLYRAHGEYDQAIDLYRAAQALQEQTADHMGQVQSLNAIGSTFLRLNRLPEALATFERAGVPAARLQSPRVDRFLLGARGSVLGEMGRHAEALPLLLSSSEGEESSYLQSMRARAIAVVYEHLGRHAEALILIDKAIAGLRKEGVNDELPRALVVRATLREATGDAAGASADAAEASAILEEMRRNLIPSDFMKRGFSESNQFIYGLNVTISARRGDASAAFLAGEQGRARAFLDLLALRNELRRARTPVDASSAAAAAPGPVAASLAGSGVSSPLAAESPSMVRLAATAARLRSTVLSYWVGDDATFLWVMTPDGQVRVRRIAVGRFELESLVNQTLPGNGAAEGKVVTTVASRGQGLELPTAPLAALRRLHTLLIDPAEAILPASGRLTIVPHGPLFKLSFAALTDKRGHYLIERYSLHYAPSLAVLEFTAQSAARPRREGYLLVANPAPLPSVIDSLDGRSRPLARLPGSERETRAIAALLPAAQTTMLDGARASETQVKAAMHGKRLLHLATHGIIRDSEPLASFIAVGETGRDAANDGRLTAEELYDVDLDSDLVVLSACRTADGQVSGDGIFGLTRALLSAGTPSVIASAWEVADETTAQLMPAFYKEWLRTGSKIESLRHAQLSLIRNLRAGRVRVQTPLGRITLSEHPLFWAGFMLIGEPQ